MTTHTLEWSPLLTLTAANVARVPRQGGIYRLSHHDGSRYLVHYVGRAGDLHARLVAHLPQNESNPCNQDKRRYYACFFRYALVDDERDRQDIEWWLYRHFHAPPCHERAPVHSGRYAKVCVNPDNAQDLVCLDTVPEE